MDGATGKLLRVPIDGGTAQQISSTQVTGFFDISPDGTTLVFTSIDHLSGHEEKLALLQVNSEAPPRLVPLQYPRLGIMHFSRDGKSVVYARREGGVDNLWQQPLDGSAGKLLTDFKAERIRDFHWSPDGKRLALVRGHNDSDVVLLHDQRQ